jgi:hypothetical protein
MAAVSHPDPAATAYHGAPARQTGTGARRVALFASGLQRSDAPTAEMAAEAVTATVAAVASRDASAGWLRNSATTPTRPPSACTGSASSLPSYRPGRNGRPVPAARAAEPEIRSKLRAATTAQRPGPGRGPSAITQHSSERTRHEPDA